MKTIKLAIVCAAVLAAPRAAGAGPAEPAAVSTGTTAVSAAVSPADRAAPPAALAHGYRATSLPMGGDQLLYVRKGDRVDVLVTFDAVMQSEDKTERKEKITSTILQNIIVLNVSRPAKVDDIGAVELLLNPVEAQYAALALGQGNIHISVRAFGDTELHPMEMASFRKLIK